jgi:hypothetical protein
MNACPVPGAPVTFNLNLTRLVMTSFNMAERNAFVTGLVKKQNFNKNCYIC